MTKILKRRRSIEQATLFKVQYIIVGTHEVLEREFKNLKSLRQWVVRNEQFVDIMIWNTLALIFDEWEPFTTIGKKTVTLSDLQKIINDLSEDYKPSDAIK